MKVLIIGNYLDNTGWSTWCQNTLLAADAAGIDTVARNIKLSNIEGEAPERIHELLARDTKHPDVVIQQTLPPFLEYNGRIPRNICAYTSETSNFRYSGWASHINLMDDAIVMNPQSKQASLASGVTVPVHVVPGAVDISKFNRSYSPLKVREEHRDSFIFLRICEFNRRKNLATLIKAFHLEFHPDENVELVLKSTPVGIKGKNEVEQLCKEIKYNLRLYPNIEDYKSEIIHVDHWSDEDIMRLHASSDCYVSTSFGEAWDYTAITSMGFGKSIIAPASTGYSSYLNDENSWVIPTIEEPVFAVQNVPENLFTGRENWYAPHLPQFRVAMRQAFENKELRETKSKAARRKIREFSYENVGKILKNVLSGEGIC